MKKNFAILKMIIVLLIFNCQNINETKIINNDGNLNYEVSYKIGFMPENTLSELPESFSKLKPIHEALRVGNYDGYKFRNIVESINFNIPSLDKCSLEEIRFLYLFGSFTSHKYVFGCGVENCKQKLPDYLGKLWENSGSKLGLPTVLTYASSVIYNWKFKDNISPIVENITFDNIEPIYLFTGNRGEEVFYMVMAIVESKGGEILQQIEKSYKNEIKAKDALKKITYKLKESHIVLKNLNPNTLDPKFFFHTLRIYLFGFNDKKLFPKGLEIYKNKFINHTGGSGAQSTLFYFINKVMGIGHGTESGKYFKDNVFKMPISHRKYIQQFENFNFKKILKTEDDKTHYNEFIKSLTRFRLGHQRFIKQYIDSQLPKKDNNMFSAGTGGSEIDIFINELINITNNSLIVVKDNIKSNSSTYFKIGIIVATISLMFYYFFIFL